MIAVIDVGTTSLRVSNLDDEGIISFSVGRKYPLIYGNDNSVTMEMSVFDAALQEALEASAEDAVLNGYSIDGFSVTAQRSSVIPVNREGQAIAPALMWQDTRSAGICENLKEKAEMVFCISGMKLAPIASAPKMAWLKQNKKSVYDAAYKLIGFCEYTVFYLSSVFATDTSIASRTCLYSQEKQSWSNNLLSLFDIDIGKLCPLIPVGSVAGYTNARISTLFRKTHGVPVISAGGDQQCAALGAGCYKKGTFVANIGSGAFVIGLSDKPLFPLGKGLNCNVSAINGKWIIEGAILSAGKTLDWINREFFENENETHPYEDFSKACALSPLGAHGMRLSVNFAGSGTPDWNPDRRGWIKGLSFLTTKNDLARATLEGLAFEIDKCIRVVEDAIGEAAMEIIISGGLSKDSLFDQIVASVCGKRVVFNKIFETTTYGAWISAQVAMKLKKDVEEAFSFVKAGMTINVFEPDKAEYEEYQCIAASLDN